MANGTVSEKEILFAGPGGMMTTDAGFLYNKTTQTLTVVNLTASNLVFGGETTVDFTTTGNTIIGDTSGDTLTVNSTSSILADMTFGTSKAVIFRNSNSTFASTSDGLLVGTMTAGLKVGPNGATNPTLSIVTSTASAATGLQVTSAAAAAGLAIAVISSGTNENLTIDAKGSGTISLGATSTGAIVLARATGVTGALTVTSASATAFAVGLAGATNPSFVVDSSVGSQAAGLKVTGATAAGTVALAAISSGAAAGLSLDAKGAGVMSIGGVSTGGITIGRTTAYTVFGGVVNTTVATQNAAPTAANMQGGLITHTSTVGAGTFTVPTGTAMDTAITGVTNGDGFWTVYANVGSQTVTITAAAGNTLTGTVAVPSGKNAQIFNVRTGTNTWISNITLSA